MVGLGREVCSGCVGVGGGRRVCVGCVGLGRGSRGGRVGVGMGKDGLSHRAGMLERLGVSLSRSAVLKILFCCRGVGV